MDFKQVLISEYASAEGIFRRWKLFFFRFFLCLAEHRLFETFIRLAILAAFKSVIEFGDGSCANQTNTIILTGETTAMSIKRKLGFVDFRVF